MQVKEVMTGKVDLVSPETSLTDAARLMEADDCGALPVGKDDRLVGMVTDRDIVCRGLANGKDPNQTTIEEVMSRGITYCFEDQPVEEAADIMANKQIRRLTVLNRDKRLVGFVSLGDLAAKTGQAELAGHTLEEISR